MEHEQLRLRLEYLRDAADAETITLDELRELAYYDYPANGDGVLVEHPMVYVGDDALQAYHWLKGWWNPEGGYPPTLRPLTIRQHLMGIRYSASHRPVRTFTESIMSFYNRCVQWCIANKLDSANPSETEADRKLRAKQERMAHARAARRVTFDKVKDPSVLEQVRAIEAQIHAAQDAAKALDAENRELVNQHQAAMYAAANKRKADAAHYRDQIAHLRKEIALLTAKQ